MKSPTHVPRGALRIVLFLAVLGVLCYIPVSRAHLLAPNEQGVSMSSWYTIVQDMNSAKKFWVMLGGTPVTIDGTEAIKFPSLFVFLSPGEPSGGTVGSSINHVGFHSSKGKELVARLKAAGVKMDANAGTRLPNPQGSSWGNVFSPDGVKVEILDSARSTAAIGAANVPAPSPLTGSIATDHIHFSVPEASIPEAQAWYAKFFGATPFNDIVPRPDEPVVSGVIPGIELKFSRSPAPAAATRGRALDRIGFEVKNLESFCGRLEAGGIKLDDPYSRARHKSYAAAELTDPWGTTIVLTEGLNKR